MDGVLKHSLYNEVLISLGKRQVDEFIDAPWKYTVEVSDAIGSRSRADQRVRSIYDATGLLLILGEPGSGKITTLLSVKSMSHARCEPPPIWLALFDELRYYYSQSVHWPMNLRLTRLTLGTLAAALVLTGCENLSLSANGAGSGALTRGIARAGGASSSEPVAIGLATGAVVGKPAYVIAKHEATEWQRRTAETRANLAYQNMSPERKALVKNRYIVVDTVREKNSTGAKSVMIYDTQSQRVVGDNVYDVKQSPKVGVSSKFDTYSAEYVGSGDNGVTPTPSPSAQTTPTPTILPTLPIFFPPKSTATVELPLNLSYGALTLKELSDRISKAFDEAGYERRSYFWLDKEHAPGFAIITHIEQIRADGTPVTTGRWSFDLPSYEHFSIPSFVKAMFKSDAGHYRMIALVVSRVPFQEKEEPMTQDQEKKLEGGPKFLARTSDSDLTVTKDYHCIAYVYEFERRTRNDDPVFKDSSDVSASAHLKSTPLWGALAKLR